MNIIVAVLTFMIGISSVVAQQVSMPANPAWLRHDDLTSLSVEKAKTIMEREGRVLSLDGLKELSPPAAKVLAGFNGEELNLMGLQALPAETAKALAVCKCDLGLNGLTTISDEALAPAPVEEDVAFFEKNYQKKITGVKPKGEYPDPDEFYSAIGQQLGIPEIAWKAAAKFGWKKEDGKQTFSILKGGPTANGGQGTWDVMFMWCMINPDTKKPDPATLQQLMMQIDYDGNIKFPEIPQGKR